MSLVMIKPSRRKKLGDIHPNASLETIYRMLQKNDTCKALMYTIEMIYHDKLSMNDITDIIIKACEYKCYKYLLKGFNTHKIFNYNCYTLLGCALYADNVKLYKIMETSFTIERIGYIFNIYEAIKHKAEKIICYIVIKHNIYNKHIEECCIKNNFNKCIKIFINKGITCGRYSDYLL